MSRKRRNGKHGKPVTVVLDDELVAWIADTARARKCSASDILRTALLDARRADLNTHQPPPSGAQVNR